jgi:putative flippase GtrA
VKFVKYVGVQVIAYGVDMGTFLLLTHFGISQPILANICAKIVAGSFAFVVHRHFTFAARDHGSAREQAARYFLVLGCNIPIAAGLMKLLMYVVGPPVVAKFISDVANVALTYWLSKLLVFGPNRRTRQG